MLNKDFVRFGGGGGTLLTPLGLALLILAALLILTADRKYLMATLLGAAFLIPISQRLVLAGVHLTVMRLLIACAWIRAYSRVRLLKGRLTRIDKTVVLWALSGAITFTLLWLSLDAFVNRAGMLYDCFGMYFLLRALVRDEQSIYNAMNILAVLSLFIGVCMLGEHVTRLNPFYVFGEASKFSPVRDGHVRAQGPFAHALLAGSFGATAMPLFAGMWWQKKGRVLAVLGMVGATLMTVSSFSSTALLAWAAGLAGLCMWPLRRYMRAFRWSIVGILVGLQMVMKAPVWALIGRADLVGGSSGYHRFELVNQTILHFSEWALLGEKTTYQWGYNLWDTANTYVETAVTGGLPTLILFIAILVLCFKALGRVRKSTRDPRRARLTWILGSTLLAHMVAFVGISYYDQTIVVWYLLLAMISMMSTNAGIERSGQLRQRQPVPVPDEVPA